MTTHNITLRAGAACLLAFAAACSSQPEPPAPAPDATVRIVDDQDALTEQFVRVYNWADQAEVVAPVADLAARDTVRHPVYQLRQEFNEAQGLATRFEDNPLPTEGAADAAAGRLQRMNQFLGEVDQHITAAEAIVRAPTIDGAALQSEAAAIKVAIEQAAVEHAGVLDFVSDPRFEAVNYVWLRPRHRLAINYSRMLNEVDGMLGYESQDWPRRWEYSSRVIERSLESARTALGALDAEGDPGLAGSLADLRSRDLAIGERLFTLREELSKPAPDRAVAIRELGAVQEELIAARGVYERLVEDGKAVEYPQYEFTDN